MKCSDEEMKLHLLCEILKGLGIIETDLKRIEAKMSKIDDQLTALTAAVQRTATDVTSILERLKTTGLTPEQTAILDQAVAALGTLDDTMEQATSGAAGHPKTGSHR